MSAVATKPESKNDEKAAAKERVYAFKTEAELKAAVDAVNADKKVPLSGYRLTIKTAIPAGTYYAMGYSAREAQGQFMATLDQVEVENVDPSVRAPVTVESALERDSNLSDDVRKKIKQILEGARKQASEGGKK